jgi:hypothetical protein
MAKVKMGDVKSGSENVKNVYRKPMSSRTSTWLEKQEFSSAEMIEIYEISDKIEYHRDKREFYHRLLASQTGPYNVDVFRLYINDIYHVEALMYLIHMCKGLSNEDKSQWMINAMLTQSYWFLPNFFDNGVCKKYGIDIEKAPLNKAMVDAILIGVGGKGSNASFSFAYETFWKALDSMGEQDVIAWYMKDLRHKYTHTIMEILTNYPNTPTAVLKDYYEVIQRIPGLVYKLAEHDNCPSEIKVSVYKETKDDKYLPQEAKDVFLF